MISRKEKFKRNKIAGIRWFAGLSLFLLAYWWVMTNYVIRDFWDPQYAFKLELLQAAIHENQGHPLWLVMGTSRVDRGVRPGILTNRMAGKDAPLIFNFGLGGGNLFREFICLRRLMEEGVKPQRVGIEILGANMSRELFEMADSPPLLIRARPDELDDYIHYSDNPSVFLDTWRRSRWDPSFKYGMKMEHQTLAWRLVPVPWMRHFESKPYDKWGWEPQPPAPIPQALYRKDFNIAKGQFGDKFENFKISPKTDIPLRRMLEMCKSAGIEVFLLRMPEGKDFQALYTPQANKEITSYLEKIKAEYDVPMIDATSWIGGAGFTDGHHLNATGAEEFTRRLGDELFKTAKTQPATH